MKLKVKIRKLLKERYGNFDTYLEHIYETKVTENLLKGDINSRKAWVTYNQIILELKHSLKDNLKVKELQYKLTESTNPNNDCIEVIRDLIHQSPELERLYYKVSNF